MATPGATYLWENFSGYVIDPDRNEIKLLTVLSRGGKPSLGDVFRDRLPAQLLPYDRHCCDLSPQGQLENLVLNPSDSILGLSQDNLVYKRKLGRLREQVQNANQTEGKAQLPAGEHLFDFDIGLIGQRQLHSCS